MSTGVIRNINSVPTNPVQMAGVNGAEMAIMVGREHGAPNFALRHFSVTPGGNTPRHSHDYEHEVFIVEGDRARLKNVTVTARNERWASVSGGPAAGGVQAGVRVIVYPSELVVDGGRVARLDSAS